ncbi:MAG: peptidyl-prolyl cis-trans isomerase [Planctomycetales bacterium]|nr:peptidyl-prolyl cis-trans isomerase [Planctomycetales bacterium]NIM07983.1 peptidyl-prolyl cis-trans isomerase [Planctomycetales bacterium]NIN07461.1 peptidyl-prolyl cis-trans isomerase [Planctomycetales bacterium]NIN76567.1 peptidyl-prolyl cis-trans isomerase [Planctomycetales bacterium]NIO33755.1 peptidyl-prolyl cis-trans isomerase [Planctomycetales bacterium]
MNFGSVLPRLCLGGICLLLAGCGSGDGNDRAVTANIAAESNSGSQIGGGATSREAPGLDPLHPQVKISTSLGEIVVQLDAEQAPITVKNFLFHASNGHYEGTVFHQVIKDYVALGGGYDGKMVEKPTHFAIRNEAYNQLRNKRGTIAMARQPDIIDSSTCQFFFNLADNVELDHTSRQSAKEFGYCVFGQVVEGLEVLDRISQAPVADRGDWTAVPVQPVVIHSIVPIR